MKFSHQLVVSSLAVFVLSACSSSPTQRRQAKDDFEYLDTPALKAWNYPAGVKRQHYANFDIPTGEYAGGTGRDVDIRPPQQVLELIPGARAERKDGEVTLWLPREADLDKVWQTALEMGKENHIKLRSQTDSRLETDWVTWKSEDEELEIGSRYELTKIESNGQHGFKISLIDWREGGKQKPVTETNKERYNALMTNLVTARYDSDLRAEAARKAQEQIKQIPVSMGTDRSGLPVIIARTPYNTLWERIPTLLPSMGFSVEDRNQSQGTVKAKYAAPKDEFWTQIGVKPVHLKGGTYTFLLGDLGNRTSINITNSDGKPVTESVLKDMVPVISAVASQEAASATK
ncbi:Beta-barrel assembly machine subunit BamC [Vibrio xiamenensis]|uniref:Outer membrane protein assembly factor BamC n=1 Tax=Vibrio xiamenensis TaxID=861298 RepID=A0A1G8D125_9VIBR|nr:outer membrane protein assembly factor BamC [Vibrio xiamenensis]SDH51069.1 Beta-barrel assembly machine subunit BamC [Vibrio xiamenensis]